MYEIKAKTVKPHAYNNCFRKAIHVTACCRGYRDSSFSKAVLERLSGPQRQRNNQAVDRRPGFFQLTIEDLEHRFYYNWSHLRDLKLFGSTGNCAVEF
jgi:hypothetical protein